MKIKVIFITLLLSFVNLISYSQNRPTVNVVKANQLYLVVNGHYIKLDDLKNSTLHNLLGNPLKIKNEKWEVNNAKNNRTYVYKNGELVLEDGVLSFVEIKKNGWSLAFKKGKTFTKPITTGSSISELKMLFPISWENKSEKVVYIQIDNCDCNVAFTYSGNVITELGFYTNES